MMLDVLMKSFKIRSKALTAVEAAKASAEMHQFFAVELHYKGSPIRLVVAASQLPDDLTRGNPTLELTTTAAGSAPALSVVEKKTGD